MPRQRSPERDRAFAIFEEHQGKIANREIAKRLGIPEKTVGGWKVKDNWPAKLNGVPQKLERSTRKRKGGAPKGNKNAVGNIGGGPVGNDKAVTHGFIRRIFPDDEDTHAILGTIETLDPLDILWQNIMIQYAAIARARRIMFVQNKDDQTKVLKREKMGDSVSEKEWDIHHAWDKHANFLQAQSRAMKTLESLIAHYEELLPGALKAEERRLRVEKLKTEVFKLQHPDGEDETEDDGFLDALKGRGSEVWSGGDVDEGEET